MKSKITGLSKTFKDVVTNGVMLTKEVENREIQMFDEIQKSVERTINMRFDILERKIMKTIESKLLDTSNITKAMESYEKGKERCEELERVTSKLSVLYAKTSSPTIVTGDKQELTREGQKVYTSITETLTEVSKYLGYKTVTKVANASLYSEFAKIKGIKTPSKRTVSVGGKYMHTVFSDLLLKGLMPDYLRFIEKKYLNE